MLHQSSPDAAATAPASLAAINDGFRAAIGHKDGVPGKFVMTQGLALKGDAFVYEVLRKVAAFSTFTEDNDPDGDHSFGAFEQDGVKIFWKIDYFEDADCAWGAEDPEKACFRVLTVMLADEW